MYLNTYNDGSYIIKASIQNTPVSIKFDFNSRVDRWFITVTSGEIVLIGGKALTPNAMIPIINFELDIVTNVMLIPISKNSVPMSKWGGYYYVFIGD